MEIIETGIKGILLIEPKIYKDQRGFFLETYQEERYKEMGIGDQFVQDNQSRSAKGVLRGLHFQVQRPQAQLLTVIRGRVFDVGVDLRPASPTFGKYYSIELDDLGPRQLYMAPGIAHGFYVLSDWADLHYKVSRRYEASDESGVLWSDPDIGIKWPLNGLPEITSRDAEYSRLKDLLPRQLPHDPPLE